MPGSDQFRVVPLEKRDVLDLARRWGRSLSVTRHWAVCTKHFDNFGFRIANVGIKKLVSSRLRFAGSPRGLQCLVSSV